MSAAGLVPICFTCRRFVGIASTDGFVCDAYPERIPTAILASVVDHRRPFEGDHGLRYEARGTGGYDRIEFKENEHPRDEDGKFSEGSKGTRRSEHASIEVVGGERRAVGGGRLPLHIVALKIPPAWTDVTYSQDPSADLLATGRDAKGRLQAVYSERFHAEQGAAKFARIQELDRKYNAVRAQNEKARGSEDARTRDSADALKLIMETGIRPGGDSDTLATQKAYGATTLEGRHVVRTPEGVFLRFVGKKGVALNIPVRDRDAAAMVLRRAEAAGPSGRLFPSTSAAALLAHTHSLDGGSFKTKDFRTLLGTRTALSEIAAASAPKDERSYRRAVMDVAKACLRGSREHADGGPAGLYQPSRILSVEVGCCLINRCYRTRVGVRSGRRYRTGGRFL
jgi:DNA topoisomerase I